MSELLIQDLKDSVSCGQAMFVVGAGVSIAATNGDQCASWTGLLRHGLQRCVDLDPSLAGGWAKIVQDQIDSGDLQMLISAAELISDRLGAPNGGEWRRWLRESVGALQVINREVLEALRDLNAPLATTNYDSLLSEVTGLRSVTWNEGAKVERVLRGEDKGILHLHGYWDSSGSVILGIRSYEKVLGDEHAQAVLRELALFKNLVFVGFGAGLGDPNFGSLLKWIAHVLPGSEYRRYRLALEREAKDLQAQHPPEERMFVVPFGQEHANLATFLRSIGTGRPCVSTGRTRVPSGSPGLPGIPRCFGRKDEVERLVAAMLAEPPRPAPVLGGPGIGKSTVTIAALHDTRVAERFGVRRFFVRCDGAMSRESLVATIARESGLTPAQNVEKGVLDFFDVTPAALALDNLESPWEQDTLAVEEFLGRLAECGNLALIVSLRGLERPAGVQWHEEQALQPLDAPAVRKTFLAIAGKRLEGDPVLDSLCAAVGCVPLAITLLAHAAEGEPNLAGLWQGWQEQRTAMLQRAGGEHRLTNLELSYEISIRGPRMTDSARSFLALLVLLPDGMAHHDLAGAFHERLADASILRKTGLAFDEADRLRVLAPLREYVSRRYPAATADCESLQSHFVSLAFSHAGAVGWTGGAEAVEMLRPEVGNIELMLLAGLEGPDAERAIDAAKDWGEFVRFTGLGSDQPIKAAAHSAKSRSMTQKQANCIRSLGDIALGRSDHAGARARYEEALPLYEKVGDVQGQANCIKSLGEIALRRSDHAGARERYEEALPLYEKVGSVLGQANCIKSLGDIALRRSDHAGARARYEEALPLYEKVGDVLGQANCIRSLGDIALERADHAGARERYEEALPLYEKVGAVLGQANCIQGLGDIALERSDDAGARERYEEALQMYRAICEPYSIGRSHQRLALLALSDDERGRHINAAREAWLSIDRADLVSELQEEFPSS
jgi:tetratricopeptide (TPR) repeat protein